MQGDRGEVTALLVRVRGCDEDARRLAGHFLRRERPGHMLQPSALVHEACQHLDPLRARIVDMRYFGGLSVEETTEALGISPRTVNRDRAVAKSWLRAELRGANSE